MKKAFFSFVAITLVALVLFMAVSYLYTFRDLRGTAERDLEVRRVAERMEDVREAVNRTIIDAAFDGGYASYGCGVAVMNASGYSTNSNATGFCGNFSNILEWYIRNMTIAFSDEILLNITGIVLGCSTNATNSTQTYGPGIYDIQPNVTKNITASLNIEILSKYVRMNESQNFAFRVDMLHSSIPAPATNVFAIRTRGISSNSSNYNSTIFYQCNV